MFRSAAAHYDRFMGATRPRWPRRSPTLRSFRRVRVRSTSTAVGAHQVKASELGSVLDGSGWKPSIIEPCTPAGVSATGLACAG